jgi:poly(rC)-binding protein 2/3/4
VQRKITPPTNNTKEGPAISRLIVSPNQVGCVLGKGGSIIAEMRKLSKAHIIVLSKDKIPRGVQENDEVVQVCFCIVNPIPQYYKQFIQIFFVLMNVYSIC